MIDELFVSGCLLFISVNVKPMKSSVGGTAHHTVKDNPIKKERKFAQFSGFIFVLTTINVMQG